MGRYWNCQTSGHIRISRTTPIGIVGRLVPREGIWHLEALRVPLLGDVLADPEQGNEGATQEDARTPGDGRDRRALGPDLALLGLATAILYRIR